MKLKRGGWSQVEVAYRGTTRSCGITRELKGGWLVADIFFGLLPLVIDAATGAWYGPSSDSCFIAFDTNHPTPASASPHVPQGNLPARSTEDALKLCNLGVERYCDLLLAPSEPANVSAESSEDRRCREGRQCEMMGLCAHGGISGCVAAKDADCLAAKICTRGGRCLAEYGRCVVERGQIPAVQTSTGSIPVPSPP